MKHDPALSRRETVCGLIYIPVTLLVLPAVLSIVNEFLPMTTVMFNFVYYCINFAVVLLLFRSFLKTSARNALKIPFPVLWYAILGYLANDLLTNLVSVLIYRFFPGFINVNNANISTMLTLSQEWRLLAVGTVLLVPVAEETLYRGVVFRSLCKKNVALAYLVSMVVFASIHVIGYVGTYSPLYMLLALIQYFPAGYCLAWCYRQTGTIMTPILMHALVNGISVYYAVR